MSMYVVSVARVVFVRAIVMREAIIKYWWIMFTGLAENMQLAWFDWLMTILPHENVSVNIIMILVITHIRLRSIWNCEYLYFDTWTFKELCHKMYLCRGFIRLICIHPSGCSFFCLCIDRKKYVFFSWHCSRIFVLPLLGALFVLIGILNQYGRLAH